MPILLRNDLLFVPIVCNGITIISVVFTCSRSINTDEVAPNTRIVVTGFLVGREIANPHGQGMAFGDDGRETEAPGIDAGHGGTPIWSSRCRQGSVVGEGLFTAHGGGRARWRDGVAYRMTPPEGGLTAQTSHACATATSMELLAEVGGDAGIAKTSKADAALAMISHYVGV